MYIADIENPFRTFMIKCGAPDSTIKHIPKTSRNTLLGMCDFFSHLWISDFKKPQSRPVLFIISLDGIGSKELYKYWEENQYSIDDIIPDEIKSCNKPIVFFDNSAEGHCDNDIFKFISHVVKKYNLNPDTTFYGNSAYNIKNIHQSSEYNNFKVIFTNNYKEDTLTELFQQTTMSMDFTKPKNHLFNCLNNAPKPHRPLLIGAMIEKGLHYENLISSPTVNFEELYTASVQFLIDEQSKNKIGFLDFKKGIKYLECLETHYPLVIDRPSEDAVHMKSFSDDPAFMGKMLSCDIQVVTETYIDHTLYLTEKTYKPIILKQPFMLLGPNRAISYLQNKGYKTYEHLYDNIGVLDINSNIINRIDAIVKDLETLTIKKDSPVHWQSIVERNSEIAEYNYDVFVKNQSHISNNSKFELNDWLSIYPDFLDVFECYE